MSALAKGQSQSRHHHRRIILAALLAGSPLALTAAMPAVAQEEPGASGLMLEEVIVTARKRMERLQDIPDSITSFSAASIESANIQNVKDMAVLVPNVSIVEAQQPGVAMINIRGVGQARNGESPVAVVIDGVQASNASQITQDLFDIERIEVLKGPQGAVYGRNAIGGAINIVTRQPTDTFEGFVQAGYGTANDKRVSASLSGPIIPERLLFRIAGSARDFDGQVDSLMTPGHDKADWQEDRNVRAGLLARPLEDVTLDLRYARLDTRAGAAYYGLITPGDDIDRPLPYAGDRASWADRVLNDASAKLDIELPGVTLTSVTALSKVSSFIDEDLDFTPLSLTIAEQSLKTRNFSQELRLTSNDGGPFKWLGGVYYLRSRQTLDTKISGGADLLPALGLPSSMAPLLLARTAARDRNKAYAGFGQLSYRFDSGLEVTGALRYDVDDRHQTDLVAAGNPEYDQTFRSWQPKLSLSYFFEADQMVYATVGKGFRSGGFNPQERITRVYDKEENWNYEAGFKTSLMDRRMVLNGAAFYTRITDRQVYILDLINSAQTLANPIPKAEVYGAELEMTARPLRGLDLSASIGLTDSKIVSYRTDVFAGLPVAGDFTGNKLPQVAGLSYALSAQYAFDLTDEATLTPRLEWNGSGGRYYWEIDNQARRSAISLVNARLTLDYDALSVTAYAENLFKEDYILEYVAMEWSGAAGNFSAAAPGRRIGIKARFDF
ncbi:TonB-dependent receptor [Niveispirillum fermenti]|uniref:TonB-dependent receptor n=1 Tax=Niveispirillum fermenti TaxID=1233113 RepID=UPI003A8B141E